MTRAELHNTLAIFQLLEQFLKEEEEKKKKQFHTNAVTNIHWKVLYMC